MIETAKLNGIYKLDESNSFVNNIHYMPDDTILQKLANKEDGTFNLVKYSETIELKADFGSIQTELNRTKSGRTRQTVPELFEFFNYF